MTTVRENHGYACPKCKSDEHLVVSFLGKARLTGDGSEDCGDHEWDENSAMTCESCDFDGKVHDFIPAEG